MALYRAWVDNTLNKSFTNGMFIERDSESIIGLILVKTDNISQIGNCSIIGVDPQKISRGVGKELWDQSFGYWANESNIDTCTVSVSVQNQRSLNFHLKIGFDKISDIKYIYHWRNTKYA